VIDNYELDTYRGVDVLFDRNGEPWLTQSQMAALFETTRQNVYNILAYAFEHEELFPDCFVHLKCTLNGKQQKQKLYNLDAILLVGHRVHAKGAASLAVRFRRHVANVMREKYFLVRYDRDEYRDRVLELEQRLADTQQDLDDAQGEVYSLYYDIEEM
jgi:hypothetical protein